MTKKLLAIFISVLLVLSLVAVPAMAEDTTSEEVTVTVAHNANSADSPDAYFIEEESNMTASNMSTGSYKSYYLNIAKAGDYTFSLTGTAFNSAKINVILDGIDLGTCTMDGYISNNSSQKSYTQYFKTIGLGEGEHKIKLTCKSGVFYMSSFTLDRKGEQTKEIYSFAFKTLKEGSAIRMGTAEEGNDAVAANSFGQYSNVYNNGWAQFLLPEGYLAGWYNISISAASTIANPLVRTYLGDTQAEGTTISGTQRSYGNLTCATSASGYGATGVSTAGQVYLDGASRYFTVSATGDTRLFRIMLIPAQLSYENSFQLSSRSLTNPNGSNMNGAPDNGVGTNQTLRFSIPVAEAGEYRIKANTVDNLNQSGTGTTVLTVSVNGTAQTSGEVTTHDWTTFAETDLGKVTLPAGTVSLSISDNGATSWRLRDFSLVKAGVNTSENYRVKNSGYIAIHPSTGFSDGGVLHGSNWATYRVPVEEAGYYKIYVKTATDASSAYIDLALGDASLGKRDVPCSGFFNFIDGPAWYAYLESGISTIRLNVWGGSARIQSLTITAVPEISITDSTGTDVTELGVRDNDTITVTGPEESTDMTMIAVLYKDGLPAKTTLAELSGTQLVAVLEGVTVADGDDCELRVYYWDAQGGIAPVSSYHTIR